MVAKKNIQVAQRIKWFPHANHVIIEDNISYSDKLAAKMCFSDKYLQTHGTSKQMKDQCQCEQVKVLSQQMT